MTTIAHSRKSFILCLNMKIIRTKKAKETFAYFAQRYQHGAVAKHVTDRTVLFWRDGFVAAVADDSKTPCWKRDVSYFDPHTRVLTITSASLSLWTPAKSKASLRKPCLRVRNMEPITARASCQTRLQFCGWKWSDWDWEPGLRWRACWKQRK